MKWLSILFGVLRSAVLPRAELALENLALRQQLAVFKHRYPGPRLQDSDRLFCLGLVESDIEKLAGVSTFLAASNRSSVAQTRL